MPNKFIEIPASNKSIAKRKPLFGVGINDSDYIVAKISDKGKIVCPYYRVWASMISRCYSSKYQKNRPTYKGCAVTSDWLIFSNFKRWMMTQEWQDKVLDKDILVTGNKIYSKDMCIFVTNQINTLLVDCARSRGMWPLGVNYKKQTNKFMACCSVNGKSNHIGYFTTPEEASAAYRAFKYRLILSASKEQVNPLKSALIRIAKEFIERIGE